MVMPAAALGRDPDWPHEPRSRRDAALMEKRLAKAIRALREFEADYAMDTAVARRHAEPGARTSRQSYRLP
jgi:hypothetical protein